MTVEQLVTATPGNNVTALVTQNGFDVGGLTAAEYARCRSLAGRYANCTFAGASYSLKLFNVDQLVVIGGAAGGPVGVEKGNVRVRATNDQYLTRTEVVVADYSAIESVAKVETFGVGGSYHFKWTVPAAIREGMNTNIEDSFFFPASHVGQQTVAEITAADYGLSATQLLRLNCPLNAVVVIDEIPKASNGTAATADTTVNIQFKLTKHFYFTLQGKDPVSL